MSIDETRSDIVDRRYDDTIPAATAPQTIDIEPGGMFDLRIHRVTKTIGDNTHRMFAYNGSIPGPLLRVQQGSEVYVNVLNDIDVDTTVHWHGLRLENAFDGVPHDTQAPIPPGGRYIHRLQFPDAGVFWYHPHMREDYEQEMGLYGNVLVAPSDPDYWPDVDREVFLTLDDILIEGDRIAPFPEHGSYTAMGRFGNVLLVNGETHQTLEVHWNEVVRFAFTNTANTRVFKVALPGARMKLVGSDAGHYEHEAWVHDVVIAPSERYIVDVMFDKPGEHILEHRTPGKIYPLATIKVSEQTLEDAAAGSFERVRTNEDMVVERRRIQPFLEAEPDKVIAAVAEMDFDEPEGATSYTCPMHPEVVRDQPGSCPECGMKLMPVAPAASTYTCPMHPEVVRDEPGKCPECGMKLMPASPARATYTCPMHPEVVRDEPGSCPECGMKLMPGNQVEAAKAQSSHTHEHDHGDAMADGIEWEDMMVEVNKKTNPQNMRWKLIDRETGKANFEIDWTFVVGDQVKIRLVNEMESDHPMHHPFHIHGERFLVLSRDGFEEPNLVWKDTVLLRTGQTIDLLMDAGNPGIWMAHCHIAEHSESGMMFNFRVQAPPA
jgi:FtsP/CotA-like multicopper oxidase with cupredoxin domain